jgi:hypothetical protein
MFCKKIPQKHFVTARAIWIQIARNRHGFCENPHTENADFSQWGTCFMNGFFRRVTVCNGASPKKGGGYAVEKESGSQLENRLSPPRLC